MVVCGNPSKDIGKMNLKLVLNKTSQRAHMELELDVLGVPRKLVKYSLHSKLLECFNWNTNFKESMRNL
jgi:hypothetical protein